MKSSNQSSIPTFEEFKGYVETFIEAKKQEYKQNVASFFEERNQVISKATAITNDIQEKRALRDSGVKNLNKQLDALEVEQNTLADRFVAEEDKKKQEQLDTQLKDLIVEKTALELKINALQSQEKSLIDLEKRQEIKKYMQAHDKVQYTAPTEVHYSNEFKEIAHLLQVAERSFSIEQGVGRAYQDKPGLEKLIENGILDLVASVETKKILYSNRMSDSDRAQRLLGEWFNLGKRISFNEYVQSQAYKF